MEAAAGLGLLVSLGVVAGTIVTIVFVLWFALRVVSRVDSTVTLLVGLNKRVDALGVMLDKRLDVIERKGSQP